MKHKYKKEICVVSSPQVRREWKEGEECKIVRSMKGKVFGMELNVGHEVEEVKNEER